MKLFNSFKKKDIEGVQYVNPFISYTAQHVLFNENNFSFKLDKSKFEFLIKGAPLIEELKSTRGATFFFDVTLNVFLNSFTFDVNSWEELYILCEIWVKGVYNIISTNTFRAIDIGLNVGFTSCFLAAKNNCKHVYSFEPVNKTYNRALENISKNGLSSKITCHNWGLGSSPRYMDIDFIEDYKGSMGINGVPYYLKCENLEINSERIELKNSSRQIKDIVAQDSDCDWIIKMDCEGAEYEILKDLSDNNLLKKIDVFMIEWHLKGPHTLIETLKDAGFHIFSFDPNSSSIGMLYAVRQKN